MSYLRVKITRYGEPDIMENKYIGDFDANQSVGSLFPKVLNPNESPEAFDIQCIYCGELLEPDKCLSDYDINTYSVLQFMIRQRHVPQSETHTATDTIRPKEVNQLLSSLRSAIRNKRLNKVIGLFSQRDYVDRAIVTTPKLGQDLLAYSVLVDAKMLGTLLRDRESLEKFLKEHPSVVPVLHSAIQTVLGPNGDPNHTHTRVSSTTDTQTLRPFAQDYTIDQEQDNDTEDDNGADPNQQSFETLVQSVPTDSRSSERSSIITSSGSAVPRVSRHQLQAAIAQAQGFLTNSSSRAGPQTRTSAHPDITREITTRGSSGRNRITPSALSQALASATSHSRQTNSTAPVVADTPMDTTTSDPWALQLAQLAEMGVTDQLAARQALEATNGDVTLAIQLLFG